MSKESISFDTTAPDGSPVAVVYIEAYLGGHNELPPTDHFEFRGDAISPTGFRSHFIHGGINGADPKDVAAEIIAHLYAERIKEGYQPGQTKLF